MEDKQIIDLIIDKLNREELWFTQKTDPTWEEPAKYYKLDEYGEPTEIAIKEIAKEVNSLIGDGAVDIDDAIDVWVDNALMEYKVAYKGTLVTKFKNKQVVDQIEAYESQVLTESKKELGMKEILDWIEKTGHIKMYNEYAKRKENAGKPIPVLVYGFYDWVNGPDAPMVGDLDFIEDDENSKIEESLDEIPEGAKIALGVCPYCGSKKLVIDYEPVHIEYNDYISYAWHCIDCGKDGQEIFGMDFLGHDVYRNDEDNSETDFIEKTENKEVNFNQNTKDKKLEDYKRRLKEENNKSANLISDMFKSQDFDADSNAGQIVMRTSELFNALSGKGYDVQVSFDNGESTNSILLGQQGGQVIITINNTNQPLRAFTSGNFEINDDNIKILTDIQNEIETL